MNTPTPDNHETTGPRADLMGCLSAIAADKANRSWLSEPGDHQWEAYYLRRPQPGEALQAQVFQLTITPGDVIALKQLAFLAAVLDSSLAPSQVAALPSDVVGAAVWLEGFYGVLTQEIVVETPTVDIGMVSFGTRQSRTVHGRLFADRTVAAVMHTRHRQEDTEDDLEHLDPGDTPFVKVTSRVLDAMAAAWTGRPSTP